MLQAPTNDRKTKAEASSKTAEHLPEQEQPTHLPRSMGRSRQAHSFQQYNNLTILQKTYGNQAMLRMMGRSPGNPPVTSSPLSQGGILQRKCACGNAADSSGTCATCQKKGKMAPLEQIQTKLTINQPGDRYEQEADRVADQVLAAPTHSAVSDAPPRIQRFAGQTTGRADMAAPASVDRVLSSPGSPLDPALQQDMEERFGHDFSSVRVHTDEPAKRSALEVNANAYTVGHRIVFGAGRYAPGTHEGRRLLAHELTHTVQQNAARNLDSDAKREQLSTVGSRLVQRDGESNVPTLDELYNNALQAARLTGGTLWQDVAEKLNGFNHEDIQSRLAQLTQDEVDNIYLGALDNPQVGPQAQVAQLTQPGTPRASTEPPTASEVSPVSAKNPETKAPPENVAEKERSLTEPMGGTYDDYKSDPDYIDNFSSAGYDPYSKTLHLFFEDGGEAVLKLPLQSTGGIKFLVFERKSLLDNPKPNDLKIYPTIHDRNTLPIVAQWLADNADEMQQCDLLLQAGVGSLQARSLPPNLWWLALLAPTASLGWRFWRFSSMRMKPAFETIKPEPGEIPIIKTGAKGGTPPVPTVEEVVPKVNEPAPKIGEPSPDHAAYANSVGEAAEGKIIPEHYNDANQLPPKYTAYDAVRGGERTYIQKQEYYKGQYISVIEETIEGGEWISIKTIEPQTATPKGIDGVVKDAITDMANKSGSIRDPIPYGDSYLRVMEANPEKILLHIQSPKPVTHSLIEAAQQAADFYSKDMVDAPIKVVVYGP